MAKAKALMYQHQIESTCIVQQQSVKQTVTVIIID